MKKITLLHAVIGLFLVTSCETNEPVNQVVADSENCYESVESRTRTVAEAAAIVRDGIKMLDDESSRAVSRTFTTLNVQTIVNGNSRSESDTLLYVFNFDADMGYAVVAADKSFNPALLAITEQGSYNVNQPSENPGLRMFMENALGWVKDSIVRDDLFDPDDPNPELKQYKMGTDTTLVVKVVPKYYLKWGQHYPEGMLCPKNICGCGPTASLIAMAILNKPTEYKFKEDDGSERIEGINWQLIRTHTQSYYTKSQYGNHMCQSSIYSHRVMSEVVKDIYNNTHTRLDSTVSSYGVVLSYGASTSTLEIFNFFNKLGMAANDFENVDTETVISRFKNNYIAFAYIKTEPDENGHYFGHGLILDGVKQYLMINGEWIKEYGKPWVCFNEFWRKTETYFHLNWGWNGSDNGYFFANVFNPSKTVERDPDTYPSYEATNYRYSKFMFLK